MVRYYRQPYPESVQRLCGGLRHHHHLVAAVALSILSQSLLRCLGAKFLSLLDCVPSDHSVPPASSSSRRTEDRHEGNCHLSCAMPSECRSPNHASDGALLHGSGRLCDLCAPVRHLHCTSCPHLFSGRTLRDPAIAIPNRHAARPCRRFRRNLVSSRCARSTYFLPWVVHRLYRHILLVA